MKTTTANSYRITQFKKELWIDMSNSCDPHFWSYSVSEKRLFLILTVLLVSLSLFYFNSYKNQNKVVREQVELYAASNAASLKRLQSTASEKEHTTSPVDFEKKVISITGTVVVTPTNTNETNQRQDKAQQSNSNESPAPSPTAVPSHQPTQPIPTNKAPLKKTVNGLSETLVDVTSQLQDTVSSAKEETAFGKSTATGKVEDVANVVLDKEKLLQLP